MYEAEFQPNSFGRQLLSTSSGALAKLFPGNLFLFNQTSYNTYSAALLASTLLATEMTSKHVIEIRRTSFQPDHEA